MMNRFLLLTKRRFFVIAGAWILAVGIHNALYAYVGEEPLFFLLAVVVIPAWFVLSVVYTLLWRIGHRGDSPGTKEA